MGTPTVLLLQGPRTFRLPPLVQSLLRPPLLPHSREHFVSSLDLDDKVSLVRYRSSFCVTQRPSVGEDDGRRTTTGAEDFSDLSPTGELKRRGR